MKYKPLKRTKFPKIVSLKRKIEQKEYGIERLLFLVANPICAANIRFICTHESTEVHHSRGRVGDLYLDKKWWKPLCHACHEYCELHPKEAKELGISYNRLDKYNEDEDEDKE